MKKLKFITIGLIAILSVSCDKKGNSFMDATIDQALPEANYVQAEYPPFTDYMVCLEV